MVPSNSSGHLNFFPKGNKTNASDEKETNVDLKFCKKTTS